MTTTAAVSWPTPNCDNQTQNIIKEEFPDDNVIVQPVKLDTSQVSANNHIGSVIIKEECPDEAVELSRLKPQLSFTNMQIKSEDQDLDLSYTNQRDAILPVNYNKTNHNSASKIAEKEEQDDKPLLIQEIETVYPDYVSRPITVPIKMENEIIDEIKPPNKRPRVENPDFIMKLLAKHSIQIPPKTTVKMEPSTDIEPCSIHWRFTAISFKCFECDQHFKREAQMYKHLAVVHKIQRHPCWLCGQSFTNDNDFFCHVTKEHSNLSSWRCPKCPNCVFSFPKDLNTHYRWFHYEGRFQCRNCSVICNTRYQFQQHYKARHEWFRCKFPNCGRMYLNNANRLHHEACHNGPPPYKCSLGSCKHQFDSNERLIHHQTTVHPYIYQCKGVRCHTTLYTEVSAWKHLNKKHGERDNCKSIKEELQECFNLVKAI